MRQTELVRGLIFATWVLIAPAAASGSTPPMFVVRDLGRIDGFAGVSATDINASGVVTGQAFNLGGASVGMVSFNG